MRQPFFALVLVAAVFLPLAGCERSSAGAPPDAYLVAVKGAVQLVQSTGKRAAKPGDRLAAPDRLEVPRGGLAVLELVASGHLVRIDEDLTMAVKDLALFGAPRAQASLAAQLDALVSPAEKKGLNERMAGFYATASAADTQPARRAEKKVAAVESDEAVGPARPAAVAPASPPPPAPAPAPPSPEEEQAALAEPPPRPQEAVGPKETTLRTFSQNQAAGAGKANVKDGVVSAEKVAAPAWPPPALLSQLKQCLQGHVAALGVGEKIGPTLTVRYRGEGGALKVLLEGALPVPRCAVELMSGSAPPRSPDAWRQFEVAL